MSVSDRVNFKKQVEGREKNGKKANKKNEKMGIIFLYYYKCNISSRNIFNF